MSSEPREVEENQHSSMQSPPDGSEAQQDFSLEELLYSSSSYHAIATPVSITMILSAMVVTYVNTEETIRDGQEALSVYETFDNTANGEATTAQTLGLSLLNALIMVSVIGAMTFVIVILYKLRCMKILGGYMIFSSSMLLGFLGGVIFDVAVNKWKLNIDKFSFYFAIWNFAAVGTTSIFWQKGIPKFVTQGYLVATSVILAWQLSHFDDWTSWTLLVMLALYDLCAVLTPCGPLRALVNLMQRDDAPEMPGLLYEAELPQEARRPARNGRSGGNSATTSNGVNPSPCSTEDPVVLIEDDTQNIQPDILEPLPIGTLPLAIAMLYRLELVTPLEPTRRNSFTPLLEATDTAVNGFVSATDNRQYSLEQLISEVEVYYPRGGGRIEHFINPSGESRYRVKDRHGEVKRILFVNQEDGRVMEERQRANQENEPESNTIKLGLGDFIFYSLLVSKAVQYSFTTFVSCMLVVLAGLGGTLVLLAVYRHALPALPISIFLGVMFYVLTRLLIEPWIHEIFQSPYYV